MSSPTFPEPHHSEVEFGADGGIDLSDPADEEAIEPTIVDPGTGSLAPFANGRVLATDVAGLSDLGRDAVARFAAEWPELPAETREQIVRETARLAEDRVELIFGRVLRAMLDDPSAVIRQLAVAALWEDQGQDLIAPLLTMLASDPSPDVRAEAARGLGTFAQLAERGNLSPVTAQELRETLLSAASDDRQPAIVRQRALEAVAVFSREPMIDRLIVDAYDDEDQPWQASALFAMAQSLDPRWLPTVIEELANPDAQLRFEAARACGAYGDDAAIPELLTCAGDEDTEVRQAAIAALGQIGGRAAVRSLTTLASTAAEVDQELIDAALEEASILADPLGKPLG